MNASPQIIYGTLPRHFSELAVRDPVQCSPLIPGSITLEACKAHEAASAVVMAPPGTLERRYVLASVLSTLAPGAPLIALAPNDKGGNRILGELQDFGCDVAQESQHHFRLCTTTRPAPLNGIDKALAEGGPQINAIHGLWTQPGIFSWDRLDAGSALLLKHLPRFHGRGADLGCGLGLLSQAALGSPEVTAITLVDIDRRAIDMATRNIRDTRAQFAWADIRHDSLPLDGLDFVLMNPPFHDAGVEDQSLGRFFIERAAALLAPGGVCWLTANRHLPYETLLATRFAQVTPVAEADGFKIFSAVK